MTKRMQRIRNRTTKRTLMRREKETTSRKTKKRVNNVRNTRVQGKEYTEEIIRWNRGREG